MLRKYKAHQRDEWLHDLRLELRRESRFAYEMIMAEHQPPAGLSSAEDASRDDFMVGSLSHSTTVMRGSDAEDSGGDFSDDEDNTYARAEMARAISSSLQDITSKLINMRAREAAAALPPERPPQMAGAPERPPQKAGAEAAADVAVGGVGSSPPAGSEGGTLRKATSPEPAAAAAERMHASTPVPPVHTSQSGAGVQAETTSPGSVSDDNEISLRLTPRADITRMGDSTGRDTMASRMSNMFRRLQHMGSPIGEDSKEQEAEEGKTAAGMAGTPRDGDRSLTHPKTIRVPSHGGIRTATEGNLPQIDDILREITHMTNEMLHYQESMRLGRSTSRTPGESRGRTRMSRTRSSAKSTKSVTKAYVEKMKFVRELSRSGMSNRAFLELDNEMQRLLWEHCNEIIWTMIIKSLGHSHRHLVGRVANEDGLGAYNCMVLLGGDQTTGAQNGILSELMSLQMEATGDAESLPCMLTYYNALNELDARFAKTNNGTGVPRSILRAKLMELPEKYSFPVHCMEQADIEDRRLGRPLKTCQQIVDYVCAWEDTRKRMAGDRRRKQSAKSGRRSRSEQASTRKTRPGRAYLARPGGPAPRSGGRGARRQPNENPHRNMRGRAARMAIQRARSGKEGGRSKKGKRCYGCGELGHFKAECPNKHMWQERGRAYNARSAHEERPRTGRNPKNHVGYVLYEIGGSQQARALSASVQKGFILDSGATGHFCTGEHRLENAHGVLKSVQGAGGQVMRGVREGQLGKLNKVLLVEGLHQGLISVGRLAEQHKACVVFTERGAFIIPAHHIEPMLVGRRPIAHRRATGLYHSQPEQIDAALSETQLRGASAGAVPKKNGHQAVAAAAAEEIELQTLARVAAACTPPFTLESSKGVALLSKLRKQQSHNARGQLKRPRLGRSRSEPRPPPRRPPMRRVKTVHGTVPRLPLKSRPPMRRVENPRKPLGPPEVDQALITDYFERVPRPKGSKERFSAAEEDFLSAVEGVNLGARDAPPSPSWEGEPLVEADEPHAPPVSLLDNAERQVLVLASTGDMALACSVAEQLGVDMGRVREDMARTPGHWANVAVESSLLTCPTCHQLGWPDCECIPCDGKETALFVQEQPEYAFNYFDKPPADPAMTFHKRLGHLPVSRMIQAFKDGGDHGIEGLTIKAIRSLGWCPECAATKQTRRGHPRVAKGRVRAPRVNQVIHTDTMERTIAGLPPDRFTKIQTFVDECTRYHWVRFFKSKGYDAFTSMLEDFEQHAHIQSRESVHWRGEGSPVKAYFSDNASELTSKPQRERLASKLIELKLCTPGESQANGIAERANRSVLEMVRVLLYQASLPLPFWPLAADMAVFLINRMPMKGNPGGKSPYELYYGKPPDRTKIRRFGCKCWVWLDKDSRPNRSKIDATARPMLFCGYNPDGTQGVRVWDPLTQRVKIRYSLIFEEDANLGVTLKGYKSDRLRFPMSRPLEVEAVEDIEDLAPEPMPTLAIDEPADGDGWGQLYSCADEETLLDIGGRFGVDPHEIQRRNEGVSGCNPRTKLIPVDAPLAEGTEIWIPTGAKEESPGSPKQIGSEEEPDQEPKETATDQGEQTWRGRLRSRARPRRALQIQYEDEVPADDEYPTEGTSTGVDWIETKSVAEAWRHRQTRNIHRLMAETPPETALPALRQKLATCVAQREKAIARQKGKRLAAELVRSCPLIAGLYINSAKAAVYYGQNECLRWLLDHQVDVNTVTARHGGKYSLLHMAAYNGQLRTCKLLLEHGARTDLVNRYGETPLDAARASKRPESRACAELLEKWWSQNAGGHPEPEQAVSKLGALQGIGGSKNKTDVSSTENCEEAARVDTTPLLKGVIEKARKAVAIQLSDRQQKPSQATCRWVSKLCQAAHEDYARAYMMERMLLVESLRGVAARDIPTPKNFKEAVKSDFADYWNEAIETEIKNLWNFETWEWVPIPADRKLVDTTWAFRVKANQKGEVDRMKARLCARGYREIWGQDYVETHAPVTCLVSWRICLALAAKNKMKVAILDIKSAYLMAYVDEDIYLSVPDGITPPAPNLCLKLRKSLYGLKQAGRCWHKLLHKKMTSLGMRQSKADPCLYLNDDDGELMTCNIHVDDCCICYTDERKYKDFRRRLEKEFQISKSDDSNSFLGMIIERIDTDEHGPCGPIMIHQRPYIEDILSRFKHQDCKPAATPSEPGLKLSKAQMPTTAEEKADMKDVPYRQCVGALLYLANCTRPDIAHAVGSCARFGSNPGRVHWKALKHVLRYLAGTRDMGIAFGKDFAEGIPHNCIHGYVDGDWGGDADDRRSTTGYIYMSYGGPVSWRSKKQSSTALSSCESEYMAASEAAKEAVWLTRLLKEDLKLEDVSLETRGDLTEREYQGAKPLTVFEDNIGCISLSKNPVSHRSSKHIEIRYHFVRERVQDGSLKLVFIPSSENVADILTKSTRRHTFLYLRDKVMYNKEKKGQKDHVKESQ